MGRSLLIARLFTTSLLVYYTANQLLEGSAPGGLMYVAMAIQVAGIVLVALGYKTRYAALMLAAFCLASTVLFYKQNALSDFYMNHLYKDLGLTGCFLFMWANGPGSLSIDGDIGPVNPGGVTAPLLFAGRLLAIMPFITAGENKVVHTANMQNYIITHNSYMSPNLIYPAIVLQLVAPVMLVLGYKTRYAALALAWFCIVATLLFHATRNEWVQVWLDFALAGGLFFMYAHGAGRFSLDERGKTKA